MPRTRRASSTVSVKPFARALLCAVGLFGGLAVGGFIIYVSGLWYRLDRVLGMSLQAITTNDLIMASASFAVVFGCGWFGTWVGLRLAAKV